MELPALISDARRSSVACKWKNALTPIKKMTIPMNDNTIPISKV